MIAAAKVAQVEELLSRARLSQREISKQSGVSRPTIKLIREGRITSGRRLAYEDDLPGVEQDGRPFVRCGGCGGKVKLPCRLCAVRELPALEPPAEIGDEADCYLPPKEDLDAFYCEQARLRDAQSRRAARHTRREIELAK